MYQVKPQASLTNTKVLIKTRGVVRRILVARALADDDQVLVGNRLRSEAETCNDETMRTIARRVAFSPGDNVFDRVSMRESCE